MRREHVIIGSDDRQIGASALAQRRLVRWPASRKAMSEIGAAETGAARCRLARFLDAVEIAPARSAAALDDLIGDCRDLLGDGHGASIEPFPFELETRMG